MCYLEKSSPRWLVYGQTRKLQFPESRSYSLPFCLRTEIKLIKQEMKNLDKRRSDIQLVAVGVYSMSLASIID